MVGSITAEPADSPIRATIFEFNGGAFEHRCVKDALAVCKGSEIFTTVIVIDLSDPESNDFVPGRFMDPDESRISLWRIRGGSVRMHQ